MTNLTPHPASAAEFSRLAPAADLSAVRPLPVHETARAEELPAIAALLGLEGLASLSVEGEILPTGEGVWRLKARVRAEATQSCVVTLAALPASYDEAFERLYAADAEETDDLDFDPDAEDPPDPLGAGVDVGAAALEALSLAIDPYPRAPGAAFAPVIAAPPGAEPMTEERAKPFAGLAALKKAMEDGG